MTALATPRHRVSVATAQMRAAADAVADASVWSMDAAETAATLVELTRLEAQVAEVKARVAGHADDLHVGQDVGASSAANWLAHATKLTRPAAYGTVKLGHDLETHPLTRDALAAGEVCEDQARIIIRWVEALPDEVDADLRAKAERHLLEQARDHDARALNRLGKHLFEVIAPEEADAHEARLLEREEAAAWARTYFKAYDDGHGIGRGEFAVPIAYFATLKKILLGHHGQEAPGRHPGCRRRAAAHPRSHGTRAVRADRALPGQEAPQDRRPQRHAAGPHRRGLPDGPRREGRGPRHRREDQPRHGPTARLRGRDHPDRPRRRLPAARRRHRSGASTPATSATP